MFRFVSFVRQAVYCVPADNFGDSIGETSKTHYSRFAESSTFFAGGSTGRRSGALKGGNDS
jgi:hypothetical protein